MRVAVVHDSLNSCGGAERVALYMVKALAEEGLKVDLATLEPTNWPKVSYIMGEDFRKYIGSEYILPPHRVFPTIYGRYVNWFFRDVIGYTAKLRKRYDLTVVTKQLHVPVLGDVIYMHFPDFYPGVEAFYYPTRYETMSLCKVLLYPNKKRCMAPDSRRSSKHWNTCNNICIT